MKTEARDAPRARSTPNQRFPISDFLAGSGEFASTSRQINQIPGLIWSNPERWWWHCPLDASAYEQTTQSPLFLFTFPQYSMVSVLADDR